MNETDSNLLLLVDQFEELFRFGLNTGDHAKREQAAEFVALLLRLAEAEAAPIYVCLTMRSDYLGDCDAFYGLPEAMNRSQYLLPRLTRWQRREAIEGPIRLAGARITQQLVDRLLNESGEFRDDLPVLQHALMRTWNQWADDGTGSIDSDHYEKIGTLKNALLQHAEEAFKELSLKEKLLAERLFKSLTETDAANRRIRRPAHLNQIAAICNAPAEEIMGIIRVFRADNRNFLVLSSENPADDPLMDISHESLIRGWGKLSEWVDKEAENVEIYRRLAETAQLHRKRRAGLYRDPELQRALNWRQREKPTPAWGERYHKGFEKAIEFLKQSRRARYAEKREKEKQQAERERLLRERTELMEKQNRQQRKTLRLTRILIIVGLVSLIIGAIFVRSTILKKLRQTFDANYNLLEEKARNALKMEHDYRETWLHAVAALEQEIDPDGLPLQPALSGTLFEPGFLKAAFAEKWFSPAPNFHAGHVTCVAFSPDGKTLASGSSDNTLRLWSVASGEEIRRLQRHTGTVWSVAFSPDGKTLASGSYDHTLRLWSVESGAEIRRLEGHTGAVWSVAFSPDGKTLASGSDDNTLRLWSVASGAEIRHLQGHTGRVWSVAFSPDGERLASGSSDNSIRLWSLASSAELCRLQGHIGRVWSVAFSPDGKTLASGSDDNTLRLWSLASGAEIRRLEGHTGAVRSVAFSPDGKTLASGSDDKTLRLWSLASGAEIGRLEGHTGTVWSVAFSPDGKTLASGSDDNTLRLWSLALGAEIHRLQGHTADVNSVAFSPDGVTLASGSSDNTLRLWSVASGAEIRRLEGHTDRVWSVAFSPRRKDAGFGIRR